ncbi:MULTISPECIES: WGR domain-containing protein [Bacillus]|uniref:WGR domain-containing protein n=1 Tax=Bacillus thuringiensis TaxID=1428 RepID=A0AAP4Q5U4_BACTU|nr:Poly(ADP-ribose) polymerase [Bacillus thuringiensis Bt407]MBN6707884.1 WGR domain-containing protein [Bacillus thuringiensis]PQZ77973.1 WGR domain-containing protein [Bacillus sp. MYb78]MDN7078291.1 WGR domain-containing protein [Bacillus thuringiensis]MDQ7259972.1 WGR domain-containing protein [Bacillus thuringiensis]
MIRLSNHTVLEKKVLNYASLGANSNKFYILELRELADGTYIVHSEYGRVGKAPQTTSKNCEALPVAKSKFKTTLNQKIRKGYKEVELDVSGNSQSTVEVSKDTKKEDLDKVKDKVLRFIGTLYKSSTSYLVKSIQTPLGALSGNQVAKGHAILDKIEALLNSPNKTTKEFEILSDEFYSIIPFVFGARVDYSNMIINSFQRLNDRKDLLGVIESVVKVQNSLEKTLDDKYKALGVSLKALSKRTKEYKRIVEKVMSTKGHNHHFDFEVQEVYEVEDMAGYNSFNPYNVSTMELFHGSRNENVLSILQSGLKVKPSSAVHTGSMFGGGIYTADCSTKSANYCWGFGSRSDNDSHYLFLCDVATGKIKEYDSAQSHLRSAPWGYNSVKGVKGRHLLHNEYIVYKESQVKIRYIIEFKAKR